MIELERDPTSGELRWFGVILLSAFGLLGAAAFWIWASTGAAALLWGLGVGLAGLYYGAPRLRRALFFGWMHAVYPLAWLVSHVLLGAVYFLVITPLGLVLRLFGRDALGSRFEPGAASYWAKRAQHRDDARYLTQS